MYCTSACAVMAAYSCSAGTRATRTSSASSAEVSMCSACTWTRTKRNTNTNTTSSYNHSYCYCNYHFNHCCFTTDSGECGRHIQMLNEPIATSITAPKEKCWDLSSYLMRCFLQQKNNTKIQRISFENKQ